MNYVTSIAGFCLYVSPKAEASMFKNLNNSSTSEDGLGYNKFHGKGLRLFSFFIRSLVVIEHHVERCFSRLRFRGGFPEAL